MKEIRKMPPWQLQATYGWENHIKLRAFRENKDAKWLYHHTMAVFYNAIVDWYWEEPKNLKAFFKYMLFRFRKYGVMPFRKHK